MSSPDETGAGPRSDALESAVFGGGCFWCLEAAYQEVRGVEEVVSGYSGGTHRAPTYGLVCGGATGHAEVVQVSYDPSVVSYGDLLDVFFAIHDPTTPDRQGADVGPQYRSIILHENEEQRETARARIEELEREGRWADPIVTEVVPLDRFYRAEPEHQDFYRRNPAQPYCGVVITPKLARARAALGPLFIDSPELP